MKNLVPVKSNILATVILLGFILLFTNGCKSSRSDEGNTTDQPNLQAAPAQSPSMTASAPNGTNRLINEKSPYLLQHARNPVDWFPWGEEAFRMAAKLDKPILLSIGYSTCHWCHVMREESFSDIEVAKVLNDVFISIKVDREERPDIDNVYMQVCQMMASSCGWPLNIIMTPDKKPFFAATYIPKESRFGRMGLIELANKVKDLWANRRDDLLQSADRTMAAITQNAQPTPGDELGEKTLHAAYSRLSNQFDDKYGGFRSAPKFPTPHVLLFLLRYYNRTGEKEALEMVEKTLEAMRLGGIYDHVGFGFHRYSTDAKWLVPHFEKMLYDQAMLAMAYVEAYQVTGKREYKDTAQEIFTYVLRDMTSPEGGFYSAEDADSDGAEGKFYVWSKQEIIDVLGEKEGQWLIDTFNVKSGGNFSGAEVPKANILHLKEPLGSGFSLSDCQKRFENDRVKLFAVREKRIHPFKDDKILTDWNGLMITALAKGGQAFNDPRYTAAAKKAADFLLDKMRDPEGRLLHRYRGGDAAIQAYADDFAFFTMGLIDLYEATFDVKYLEAAIELNDYMLDHFWDKKLGGLFFTSDVAELVLIRSKDIYDGAIPSGNSVAAYNLMRLGRITANTNYEKKAAQIGRAFSRMIERSPPSYAQMMVAVNFWVGPSYEVVISGDPESKDTLEMINALREQFIPNKVVVFRPDGQAPKITAIAKYTENQRSVKGKATAYVCLNYQCRAPTNSIKEMLSAFEIKR